MLTGWLSLLFPAPLLCSQLLTEAGDGSVDGKLGQINDCPSQHGRRSGVNEWIATIHSVCQEHTFELVASDHFLLSQKCHLPKR